MKKYEYKCVLIFGMSERTTIILNSYGQDGMEKNRTKSIYFYIII